MPECVSDILLRKGSQVYSVQPDATVYEAIALMAEKHIGAVLVCDEDDRLLGILSERDYARKVVLEGKASRETRVGEIMTAPVIYVTPEKTVEECMRVMTDGRIRHLPVLQNDRVVGVVSIGDLVASIISGQEETIRYLTSYIGGGYPG